MGLHWLSTPLQGWPGACKLPSVGGYYIYIGLNCFHCQSIMLNSPLLRAAVLFFLWLKPKNYLSNSLGTNLLGVTTWAQRGPLSLLPLAKSDLSSSPNQFISLIFQGDRNWSGVRKGCDAYLCREWKQHTGNNSCVCTCSLEGKRFHITTKRWSWWSRIWEYLSSKTQCCRCPFLNRVSQQTFMATSSLKQKNLCSAENSKLASGSSIWGTAHADLEESFDFSNISLPFHVICFILEKEGKQKNAMKQWRVWHSRLLKMKNATWERFD